MEQLLELEEKLISLKEDAEQLQSLINAETDEEKKASMQQELYELWDKITDVEIEIKYFTNFGTFI